MAAFIPPGRGRDKRFSDVPLSPEWRRAGTDHGSYQRQRTYLEDHESGVNSVGVYRRLPGPRAMLASCCQGRPYGDHYGTGS